jgi:hypothetical protein
VVYRIVIGPVKTVCTYMLEFERICI